MPRFTSPGRAIELPPPKVCYDALDTLQTQRADLIYFQASADTEAVNEIDEIRGRFPSLPIVLACARPRGRACPGRLACRCDGHRFLPADPRIPGCQPAAQRAAACRPRDPEQALPVPARFFFFDEAGKESRVNIFPPRFTIGRSHGNDLILGHLGRIAVARRGIGPERGILAARSEQQAGNLFEWSQSEPGKADHTATRFSLAALQGLA